MIQNSIISQAQEEVVGILSADAILSAVPIFPENLRDLEFQLKNALGRQGIVGIVVTPTIRYIGDYGLTTGQAKFNGVPAYEIQDLTIQYAENVAVNRAQLSAITAQEAAVRALETLGSGQNHGTFSPSDVRTTDENGLVISRAVCKCVLIDADRPVIPELSVLPIEISANGVYQQENVAYSPISVNVPWPVMQGKTATVNGQTIEPDVGFALSSVLVNIPRTSKSITENGLYTYLEDEQISSLTVDVQPILKTETFMANGYYEAMPPYQGYSQVEVNVQPELQTLTITRNGTYMPSAGFDGFGQITVSVDLAYPINKTGTILDQNINVVSSGTFVIPEGFKDLIIKFNGTPESLEFADAGIIKYGDDLPTVSANYLMTVTRIDDSEAYFKAITLES